MKQEMRPIPVVCAIIRQGGSILIVQRQGEDVGAGDWEFPGGKIESGESPEQALKREIEEELALKIKVLSLLGENTHQYSVKKIQLFAYWCEIESGVMELREHQAFRWVHPSEIIVAMLSAADRPFVQLIKNQSSK